MCECVRGTLSVIIFMLVMQETDLWGIFLMAGRVS